MSDIDDFGGPINRPASNARQGTPGDLGHTQSFGDGAQDFLGLGGGPGSVPIGQDPFAQPAVPPPAQPSESWLLEGADEAPVTIPRSIAASQPVEAPALLNTSWSEPERKGSKGRWVGALLGVASLGALALIGYPRLVQRAEPVPERIAQPTREPDESLKVSEAAALAAVADDLDTPGAIEPADEFSAPLSGTTNTPVVNSTTTSRVLVGREPEETRPTTALEENGLVEVVDPTAAAESDAAAEAKAARRERIARRRALKAQAELERREQELALAAMNAECEQEPQDTTTGASLLEIASTLGDTGPTEIESAQEEPATPAVIEPVATAEESEASDKGWPGVSWLDEIEQLVTGRGAESTPPTTESAETAVAAESELISPPASDVDTTWLEFEGTGVPPASNDAEAEARADAKRERRAAARAARWRAREEALEAARIEHEAALASMNADCTQETGQTTPIARVSGEVFWTPALGELPLPGSWAESAPQAPMFEGAALVATGESTTTSSTEPESASETSTEIETNRQETPAETAASSTLDVTLETAPPELAPVATPSTEPEPNEATSAENAPIEPAPIETAKEGQPIEIAPSQPTPVEPSATPTTPPVVTESVATTSTEPAKPFLGPPAPNGIPPTTPTGVEGASTNPEAQNSGNARVTKLTEQDVVQPTRAQSIVRAASNDERKGVWDGETIPLEEISRKTRLLTPKVGKVRATLTSGELFEGTLYAVGEECVWLDTSYGRMGLSGTRVKSVVRLEQPKDPAKPEAGRTTSSERVHIKTPGGTVAGQLLEDDGKNAVVLTDSGARLTVESSKIERIGEQQPQVRVQPRKQP